MRFAPRLIVRSKSRGPDRQPGSISSRPTAASARVEAPAAEAPRAGSADAGFGDEVGALALEVEDLEHVLVAHAVDDDVGDGHEDLVEEPRRAQDAEQRDTPLAIEVAHAALREEAAVGAAQRLGI